MRYRALDADGDYQFGTSNAQFLVDSPDAVAQAVLTRLQLRTGEWFLDLLEGTPYDTEILGEGTQALYDQAIQERIIGTNGVLSLVEYSSTLDKNRKLSVSATIATVYGNATITTTGNLA
jgi:hypothetical protein